MKITSIICFIACLLGITSLAQEKQNNFKPFSVNIKTGYTTTFEKSKLLIVGGKYDLKNSMNIGGSLSWHYNKNWSLVMAAMSGKYSLSMIEGNYPNMEMYRYQMSLGSIWITPVNLSVRYNFTSKSTKIIPYFFAGGTYIIFHSVDPGWGADQINYTNVLGVNMGGGIEYNLNDNWFLNAEIFSLVSDRGRVVLDFNKSMNWEIESQLQPHQLNLNLGLGYRF